MSRERGQTRACRTGKVLFPTQRQADRAALDARIARALRGNVRRREVRAYRCLSCHGWHLSSQTRR